MNKLMSMLLLSTFFGLFLSSATISADSTEIIDQVRLTVPIACTMIGTNTAHTATLNPGTYSGASGSEYENGIGKTTLTAICNDDNGFSIYAIGYTGNSYDSENHTKLVGSNTNITIPTKTYASGDTTSNWSMKLTKVSDASQSYNPQNLTIQSDAEGAFSTWHSVPERYAKVAEYHANTGSSTTDTTLGVKLETTYAVYIASMQSADIYTGQVKYTLVHPYDEEPLLPQASTAGCIKYFANASNAIGTMGCQPAADGNNVDLLASNFSRTGYGFAGWSDAYDYATNQNAHFYGPQETITVPTGTSANGLSLYAVWIKSEGSIQNATKVADVCSRLITASTDGTANLTSVSALTDQRDNNTYAIAKLADDKCWMIENLRLDNNSEHNNDGLLAQGYNSNFVGLARSEIPWANGSTTANDLYSIDGVNDTINVATASRFPRYNYGNTHARANTPTSNNAAMFSYGNYYTWAAAIADTSAYSTINQNISNTSLCPAGWHLPTGGGAYAATSTGGVNVTGVQSTYTEFYNLGYLVMDKTRTAYEDTPNGFNSYYSANTVNQRGDTASSALRRYPNNIIFAGRISNSLMYNVGTYAYYWSSSVHSASSVYFLNMNSSTARPGTSNGDLYYGRSIRCIASNEL